MAKKATKQKTATVAGHIFIGATVAEAKAVGQQAIAHYVRESNIGPSYYRVGDSIVLVWATLDGWAYRIVRPEYGGGTGRAMCYTSGTRESAIASAIAHAASWAWVADLSDDTAYQRDHNYMVTQFWPARQHASPDLATALDAAHKQCVENCAWQRRYRAANAAGASDTESHAIACRTVSIDDAIKAVRLAT